MQEISVRVLNMVRRTLLEHPEMDDRTLYAAAVALEPSIGDLTLQQFQARYPHRVRKKELGERTARPSEGRVLPGIPFTERPHLYAVGSDVLSPSAPASSGSVDKPSADSPPDFRTSGVRRRHTGTAIHDGGSRAESLMESGAQSVTTPSIGDTTAEDSGSPGASPPPWPLLLHPETSQREPAKRRASRRRQRGGDSQPAGSKETPSDVSPERNGSSGAAPDQRIAGQRGRSRRTAADPTVDVSRLKAETRRILFSWASELVNAEARGDFVRALSRAEDHVAAIAELWIDGGESADRMDHDRIPAIDRGQRSEATNTQPPRPKTRPARPVIPVRKHISEYKAAELDALVEWKMSAGRYRTDDKIVNAVFAELPFRRRGHRITAEIRRSLERIRGRTIE
jgi:hypothetical protein